MNRDHSAPLLPSLTLLACLLVGGCSIFQAQSQLRGNHVDADQLKELVPGTSTRADVTALIGSPTARAIMAASALESIPPDKKIPSGTSLMR